MILRMLSVLLLCSTSLFAQQGEGLVTIGLDENATGASLSGTFNVRSSATGLANTDARAAFTLALAALPNGGEIRVLPGTYVFESVLTVNTDGIRIIGSSGTLLRIDHTDQAAGLCDVQADSFALVGLGVEVAASAFGRACVRSSGLGTVIRQCEFETAPGVVFSARSHLDFVAGGHDGLVIGNRFQGTPTAVQGEVFFIRGIGVSGLRIRENDFSGDPYCRSAIRLASSVGYQVTHNVFTDLREWSAGMGALIRLEVTNAGLVYGNTIENCRFAKLVHASGMRSVPGGVFAANLLADPDGAAAWGVHDETGGLVIHANHFDGFGTAGREALLLEGTVPGVVSFNQFDASAGTQIEGDAAATLLVANQFRTEPGVSPAAPAVDLFGPQGGHLVYGNVVHAAPLTVWGCPVIQISPSNQSGYITEDNWAPDCEPGKPLCFGDGSEGPCPCGNEADASGEGCKHSGGIGIRIAGSGSASIAADDLTLTCTQLPLVNSGIFYVGQTSLHPGVPLFDGMSGSLLYSGLQCAGGNVLRLRGLFQSQGTVSDTNFVSLDPSMSYFQPGSTYYFQFWTRDSFAPNPCVAIQRANFSPSYAVCMGP